MDSRAVTVSSAKVDVVELSNMQASWKPSWLCGVAPSSWVDEEEKNRKNATNTKVKG